MNFQQQQQQQNEQTSGLNLQDVCTSLTQNFQMQSINSFQHLSSQYIDQIVEIEMKRLKANCSREEANYVEEMLLENPIIVERRTTSSTLSTKTTASSPSSSSLNKANRIVAPDYCYSNLQDVGDNHKEILLQQQQQRPQERSDSCRRSRINNKIKKAKSKYRHSFMSKKLLQSANVLECLQKLIEHTENQLINQGYNALQLFKLKKVFYNRLMAME